MSVPCIIILSASIHKNSGRKRCSRNSTRAPQLHLHSSLNLYSFFAARSSQFVLPRSTIAAIAPFISESLCAFRLSFFPLNHHFSLPTSFVLHSSFPIRHSLFAIRYSFSAPIQHFSLPTSFVPHSYFPIRHLPFAIRYSLFAIRYPRVFIIPSAPNCKL